MKIFSFSPFGYEGSLVHVEVDLRRGIPAVDIVGLADSAIKESRERMRSAIRNSGLPFPPERVLISLSPADLKKEGAAFDLAIALAVLGAKEALDESESMISHESPFKYDEDSVLVMGELELNGKLRPVRAVHAAVRTAFECGITKCIVPKGNLNEALEIQGMKAFGAENLADAFRGLNDSSVFSSDAPAEKQELFGIPEDAVEIEGILFPPVSADYEYGLVKNQNRLIRALQIAAAGGHNLLAYGPPGCGKTLSLQMFPALTPYMTLEEAQSVTRIYSIAGLLNSEKPVLREAPFRMPHQTATIEGMCGGGPKCNPGEISLAHNGTLFLDEAAEFKSSVLQMLRVPIEGGMITLSRAGRSTVFPARFQLLLSTNPCPCGNFGSSEKICLCSAKSVDQYWKKFSGPLLDRIDLRIQVETGGKKDCENSKSTMDLRKDIARAIRVQRERQDKKNGNLRPEEILEFCSCSDSAKSILDDAIMKYGISPRGTNGILKVARTICDMKESDIIDEAAIIEAIDLRRGNGSFDILNT